MVITIFVRHAPGCKWAGDEFHKSCNCKKHFRWSKGGKQYRRTAGTRTWAEAEEGKRRLEDQLAGRGTPPDTVTLAVAVDSFLLNKGVQGIQPAGIARYKLELARLVTFAEGRGAFTVPALTMELLNGYRNTWPALYPSSYTRVIVQKRLKTFLRFCYDAGWLARVPHLSSIKNTAPETLPLTAGEYASVLAAAPNARIRALIQLMRWSGLAVQDASTLKRSALDLDAETGIYRIISTRVKTGTHLYIPIPSSVAAELLAVANGNPVFVFWNRREGSAMSHATHLSVDIAEVFKVAGVASLGHMVSHRLRATFAVDLLQKGVPLEHVSKLLGHRSVVTTEKSYARWVKGRQDRLDSLVSATWKK